MFGRKRWVLIFTAPDKGLLELDINTVCAREHLRLISVSHQTNKFAEQEACVVVEGWCWHG